MLSASAVYSSPFSAVGCIIPISVAMVTKLNIRISESHAPCYWRKSAAIGKQTTWNVTGTFFIRTVFSQNWPHLDFICSSLVLPQVSSVGSSLSVQPSFFNSDLLQQQQQQQQQQNAMIWASPGLKHLGSQSRLSVPLGLPSSAGDYQMQSGGGGAAPGLYQLPPVADTGV